MPGASGVEIFSCSAPGLPAPEKEKSGGEDNVGRNADCGRKRVRVDAAQKRDQLQQAEDDCKQKVYNIIFQIHMQNDADDECKDDQPDKAGRQHPGYGPSVPVGCLVNDQTYDHAQINL